MLNLFPVTAADPVAVDSSSSKKNDNVDQLKKTIKDHFNDTKTVRRWGSRTRILVATVEPPTIDESFAYDSRVAAEDDSTAIEESSDTAAAASALKISSPNLLLPYAQTAMLPPSILRQQLHHHPVPVSPMAYNNNNINMMPPPHPAYSYYNCYDYSCNSAGNTRRGGGRPDIKNVEVHSSSGSTSLGGGAGGGGCDYSYCSGMDSSSYCTTPSLLLTEPCEGLAKLVLRTVDTFATSIVRVMDYGEELCDNSGNNNNTNNNNSSSSIGTGGSRSTMSNEYVDLLTKIERLQKMVTEKETVFVATEKEKDGVAPSTPNGTSTKMLINDLTESPITAKEEDETMISHPTINDTKTMGNPSTINEDGMVSSGIPRISSNVPVVEITTSSQDWSVLNESLTVLNESIETDLDDFQNVVGESKDKTVGGEDNSVVTELTSSFFNNDTMTTSNLCSKSIEVDKQNEEESKQLVNRSKGSKLKKFFNPKLLVNKGVNKHSTLLDDQPAVDSMGFPIDDKFSSSSDNVLSSWGSDFSSSSSNLFRRASSIGSAESSPVSVATTLESSSCANCGLEGKSVYKTKKKNLMICSQCQTTYYCSSECQSEDWSNGHFKSCQPLAAAASSNEVLL